MVMPLYDKIADDETYILTLLADAPPWEAIMARKSGIEILMFLCAFVFRISKRFCFCDLSGKFKQSDVVPVLTAKVIKFSKYVVHSSCSQKTK